MSRHFGVPQKPTVFLSQEEMDEIDMAAVRETAVISWLVSCGTVICIFLAVAYVAAGVLFSVE